MTRAFAGTATLPTATGTGTRQLSVTVTARTGTAKAWTRTGHPTRCRAAWTGRVAHRQAARPVRGQVDPDLVCVEECDDRLKFLIVAE
jgi:hypothetical protein